MCDMSPFFSEKPESKLDHKFKNVTIIKYW